MFLLCPYLFGIVTLCFCAQYKIVIKGNVLHYSCKLSYIVVVLLSMESKRLLLPKLSQLSETL